MSGMLGSDLLLGGGGGSGGDGSADLEDAALTGTPTTPAPPMLPDAGGPQTPAQVAQAGWVWGLLSALSNLLGTKADANNAALTGTPRLSNVNGSGIVELSAATGTHLAALRFLRNGLTRWSIFMNGDAEAGSNAGSLLQINRFNDAGSFSGTLVQADRATGEVSFPVRMSSPRHHVDAEFYLQIFGGASGPTLAWDAGDYDKYERLLNRRDFYIENLRRLSISLEGVAFDYRTVQKEVALTDAATIATDARLGNIFAVTLAGSRTLANPTNLVQGQHFTWKIKQDASATYRTLAFGSLFKWSGGAAPALTPTPNALDVISAYYDGSILVCSFLPDVR